MDFFKKLHGKTALVTGTGQGIGFRVASDLLDCGCDIIAHYYTENRNSGKLAAMAEKSGRKAWTIKADLTNPEGVRILVEQTRNITGRLDILVNNTGGLIARRRLGEVDDDFWGKVMDINVTSTMMVTRELLPFLEKAGSSSIINLASLAGRKGGHPGSLAYSTAKGAIITFTRSLAAEVAPKGIRVNCVAPGLILGTAFHDTFTTQESIDATVRNIPLGRPGYPEDVSRAIIFLASEFDGFITGVTLDINGGIYMA